MQTYSTYVGVVSRGTTSFGFGVFNKYVELAPESCQTSTWN